MLQHLLLLVDHHAYQFDSPFMANEQAVSIYIILQCVGS